MENVVSKLRGLVDGLFHKKAVKAEEPEQRVIDTVGDKHLAKDILMTEIFGCALKVIENEVDAEFEVVAQEALAKYVGVPGVAGELIEQAKMKAKVDGKGVVTWSKEEQCRMEADEFRESARKMMEEIKSMRHMKDQEYSGTESKVLDENGDEITTYEYVGPDFPGCAWLLSRLMDRKTRGDYKVNLTEERISKELFGGNVENVRRMERAGDAIYKKILTTAGDVIYQPNPVADDEKQAEFERMALFAGEAACEMFGGLDKKIIQFPATRAERERYM